MNRIMYLLLMVLFVTALYSCKESKAPVDDVVNKTQTNDFYPTWLIGDWQRKENKEGSQTYETWKQVDKDLFIGLGCTLKGQDTSWKENLVLSKKNDQWTYDVTQMGDTSVTSFVITEMMKNKFICVNETNDFPKHIEYAFVDDEIHAVISGGGPTIPFNFRRKPSNSSQKGETH